MAKLNDKSQNESLTEEETASESASVKKRPSPVDRATAVKWGGAAQKGAPVQKGDPVQKKTSEQEEAPAESETVPAPGKGPSVWICQYVPGNHVSRWTQDAHPGSIIPWKTGKRSLPKGMRAGDPVIYWRAINPADKNDRGGIVGTGKIVSVDTERDVLGILRIPTRVLEFFEKEPISRDDVKKAGLTKKNFQGAILSVPLDEAHSVNEVLIQHQRRPLEIDLPKERFDTDFVADRPEQERDLLSRAPLAFALAAHLNRIWETQAGIAPDRNGDSGSGKTTADESAFIFHVDAPWGGGKSTFANFLAGMLNPRASRANGRSESSVRQGLPFDDEGYWPVRFHRRRWFIVNFNAWRHEHVSPPWWNLSETIRRQCDCTLRGRMLSGRNGPISFLRWGWRKFTEFGWRLMTPPMIRASIAIALVALSTKVAIDKKWLPSLVELFPTGGETRKALAAALGLTVSGGLMVSIVSAFRSGVKNLIGGLSTSTDTERLGESDPLDRFRSHFTRSIKRLGDPVLVVVDDLDRCSPQYVVELMRGMLTVFRSPRVIFLILGDRNWIETAFAKVHDGMKEAHHDIQVSFGKRFAEKAIQMSFVLPEVEETARTAYVAAILGKVGGPRAGNNGGASIQAIGKLESFQNDVRNRLALVDRMVDQQTAYQELQSGLDQFEGDFQETAKTILNREAMLRAATARSAITDIGHAIEPLADYLPSNPRRVKRIINMIAAYQASAQFTVGIQPGDLRWRQLVLWIVIMSEYPEVWRKMMFGSTVEDILFIAGEAGSPSPQAAAQRDERLDALLTGRPFSGEEDSDGVPRIDVEALKWLRRLTPLT